MYKIYKTTTIIFYKILMGYMDPKYTQISIHFTLDMNHDSESQTPHPPYPLNPVDQESAWWVVSSP